MLLIEGLGVKVKDRQILHNINLTINPGEVHVLFGPNGAGKTSLLMTLMGFSGYQVTSGRIVWKGEDITNLPTDERSKRGIGISFQRPPTIRGLKMSQFLDICNQYGQDIEQLTYDLGLQDFMDRDINDGFSGGEIKRSEILQLMLQKPKLSLLDEPESGVDLENIVILGEAINRLLNKRISHHSSQPPKEIRDKRAESGLIITHTGHILNYVDADVGHVLYNGALDCVGNPREILHCLEELGYEECIRCKRN
ncbi:MAG: ABC transporter ATP-binding protein [bacterium]